MCDKYWDGMGERITLTRYHFPQFQLSYPFVCINCSMYLSYFINLVFSHLSRFATDRPYALIHTLNAYESIDTDEVVLFAPLGDDFDGSLQNTGRYGM